MTTIPKTAPAPKPPPDQPAVPPDQHPKGQNLSQRLRRTLRETKAMIAMWTDIQFPIMLRLSLGIIYLWFGALKVVPGSSPAEQLVADTVHQVSKLLPIVSLPSQPTILALALWETIIGLGLMIGWKPRFFLSLLALHMVGALAPLVLLPQMVWSTFPHVLTLEGQYIVKNLVIISGAIACTKTINLTDPDTNVRPSKTSAWR